MQHNYPHIGDTSFPDLDNVNAYKYQNEYDYSQYTDSVKIKMMNVSWCSDYENVVFFESKEERDAWFDAQEGVLTDKPLMFRLYNDGSVKVPLPIDECMQYNYVMIDYDKLPQQETATKDSKMFYFISAMNQASVNATELFLTIDYWTCYINDMNIQYVNLSRGHYPMSKTTVEDYLANPIENSEYLLSPDVNYDDSRGRTVNSRYVILNDSSDLMLCFATNGGFAIGADNNALWDGKVNTSAYYPGSQLPSAVVVIACAFSSWQTFQQNVEAQRPQFLQTVKGMFIVPRKLMSLSSETFDFCGVAFYSVNGDTNKSFDTVNLTKADFNYDSSYADIAKLYTYPYAAIEIDDFSGNVMELHLEDTSNSFQVNTVMNTMYPFINVEAYFTGIGNNSRNTVHFFQSSENTFVYGGKFYNFNTKWSIPVFAVQLTAENDWSLNGDINASAVKNNAYDMADNNQTNSNAAALTSKNMINASNAATMDNVETTNTWANSKLTLDNGFIDSVTKVNADKIYDDSDKDWVYAYQIGTQQQDYAAATTFNNVAMAAATVGIGLVTAGMSAGVATDVAIAKGATDVATGAITTNAMIGAGGSIAGGVVQAAGASANYGVWLTKNQSTITLAQGLIEDKAKIAADAAYDTAGHTTNHDSQVVAGEIAKNTAVNTKMTETSDTNALNNYNTTIANTARTYGMATGNSDRTYTASHDQTIIHNHPQFGQLTGDPNLCDKPWGFNINIVTQSKNAIRQTAEQFLRYGYFFNMEVDIDSFNIMPNFSYWQCDKVYCNDHGVFTGAQDVIKSILNNGVTVWSDPAKIGVTSIYDNIEVTNE